MDDRRCRLSKTQLVNIIMTRNLKMDGCRLDSLRYSDGFERRRSVLEGIDLGLPANRHNGSWQNIHTISTCEDRARARCEHTGAFIEHRLLPEGARSARGHLSLLARAPCAYRSWCARPTPLLPCLAEKDVREGNHN